MKKSQDVKGKNKKEKMQEHLDKPGIKTKILLMVQNFDIAWKSYVSLKLFMMLSSVAVTCQKGRSRVSKCFM